MHTTDSLPKVLIVNDDASTLLALASMLEDPLETPRYEVFTVQSGEEALRKVLKHNFAVILLDISMPTMNGFETAEAIHAHPRSASVPIIFVTAYYGDEFNRLKGYQRGAADYLFAPLIPKIVQSKVAVFVELNQKNIELERKTVELEAINVDLRIQRLQDLERVNNALKTEVQERRIAEQLATELATRDTLTGLFNRRSLLERLKHAIVPASRRKEGLALMFLDLDKFKEINDTFGHEVGDELLKQVATLLNASVRESDLVARLGGDEFVILLEGFPETSDVVKVAKKIINANIEPHVIGSHLVKTSTTIGISLYPQDGITAEELLKNADVAMYHAKQRERGSIQFFHEELNATERLRNEFEQDVQRALENNEFELYYQPKIDITSGLATGVEALLYWHHPRDGLLAPAHFLSRVIQSTQAVRVSDWVINAACAQMQRWNNILKPFSLPIAVNLDIAHLQPDFFNTIAHALEEYEVAPESLHVEIDESAVVSDLARAAAIFRELSDGGVNIVLDGFGAGFSSLAALKALPISLVKIDPRLMQSSGRQYNFLPAQAAFPEDTSTFSALLAMARSFGLRVVAEGVEKQEQFDALKALGCDEYQGAFFSEPLSADDLLHRLQLTSLLSHSA
ncbi:MAG: EAL domain-containing protein [Moraxellaceae bacterium]|nr:MAG: EAL domain-containing protein [Moraxellaceae bacterium]